MLTPSDTARRINSPLLQGRGRGWGLSVTRNAESAQFAREMRNAPTEPEKRLWRALSRSQLGGFKFRRQAPIGPFIADFLCPQKALVVEVDGETHDSECDRKRDAALAGMGFATIHVTNTEVMRNMEGVLTVVLNALHEASDRWATPHPNPSPEEEGLSGTSFIQGLNP